MKIYLRTIKNKEHPVEINDDTLVSHLMDETVEGFKPDFSRDAILLVFKGKVLSEDKTVSSYGLKDEDRIVAMSQKKKNIGKTPKPKQPEPQPAAATEATPAAPTPAAPTPAAPVVPASPQKKEEPSHDIPMDGTDASPKPTEDDDDDRIPQEVPAETIEGLKQLVAMGFDRDLSLRMIEATNGDVDRAASLLLEGEMKADSEAMSLVEPALRNALDDLNDEADGITEYTVPEGHPLYELVTSDAFAEMKTQVRQDPSSLGNFIVQMFNANPDLIGLILQHEEEFLKCLVGERIASSISALRMSANANGAFRQGNFPAEQFMAQEAIDNITKDFNEEDQAAITRLSELGFSKEQCIEAYIACDKNEEAAANFLFDEMM